MIHGRPIFGATGRERQEVSNTKDSSMGDSGGISSALPWTLADAASNKLRATTASVVKDLTIGL